jgi:hypothetical protein
MDTNNPIVLLPQVTQFTASLKFMAGVIESSQSSLASLGAFTYGLLPEITANLNDAAADSVNRCDISVATRAVALTLPGSCLADRGFGLRCVACTL